ncbi:MAG: hypothetical protein P8P30_02010 [Rickettsiales bacterium]|nr:hypothetical protein [Rickettsiales bacterium]
MSKHLTTVALVAAGVVAAGFLMNTFKDIDLVNQARNGFDV